MPAVVAIATDGQVKLAAGDKLLYSLFKTIDYRRLIMAYFRKSGTL